MPNVPYVLHTCYGKHKNSAGQYIDYLFATIKNSDNPEKAIIKLVPDTSMDFWLTKPEFRNHTHKKETASFGELDRYRAPVIDIPKKAAELLGTTTGYYTSLRDVAQSPYVYGADIDFEYIFKLRNLNYLEKLRKTDPSILPEIPTTWINKGALDIEQSILGGDEIISISFIDHKHNVYVAVYEPFLKGKSQEELERRCREILADKIEKYSLKLHFFVTPYEKDMLIWTFDKIHKSDVDFVATWNMNYDVPTMISRMERHGLDPAALFNHPDIPKEYRVFKYHEDARPMQLVGHYTEKWHWCDHVAKFRFYDAMALYSRNRKAETKLTTYKLGAILEREGIETKLFAAQENTHYIMQTTRFIEYVAYNIWDSGGNKFLEDKVCDVDNMVGLCGANPYRVYHKTTTTGEQDYYAFALERGKCTATVCGSIRSEFDDLIGKKGGTVLDPNRTINTGCYLLSDYFIRTNICVSISDIDARSMYPYLNMLLNASKDTNTLTIVKINGSADCVEDFMTHYVGVAENALYLLNKYFTIPSLREIIQLYEQRKVNG